MKALYHPLCKPPNTCNYSLSAIDYNNYIHNYDLGKNRHLISKNNFFIYNIGWNREMNH